MLYSDNVCGGQKDEDELVKRKLYKMSLAFDFSKLVQTFLLTCFAFQN